MSQLGRNLIKGVARFFENEAVCKDDSDDEFHSLENDDETDDSIIIRDEEEVETSDDEDNDSTETYSDKNKKRSRKNTRQSKRIVTSDNENEIEVRVDMQVPDAIPNAKKRKAGANEDTKLPGDSTYPISAWSLTISRINGDIPAEYLTNIQEFLKQFCIRGNSFALKSMTVCIINWGYFF